jgi:hypothetical protein
MLASPRLTQLRDAAGVTFASQIAAIRIWRDYAGITCVMSEIHSLALRQADQARADFPAIESDREVT